MKPKKKKLSITIDSDIILEIKELAKKDERSISQYINLVLRSYTLKRRELAGTKPNKNMQSVSSDEES